MLKPGEGEVGGSRGGSRGGQGGGQGGVKGGVSVLHITVDIRYYSS